MSTTMHPNRNPFDTRGATDHITAAVAETLKLRRRKDSGVRAAIRAAVAREVKQLGESTRRTVIRTAVSRRKVRAALADIL